MGHGLTVALNAIKVPRVHGFCRFKCFIEDAAIPSFSWRAKRITKMNANKRHETKDPLPKKGAEEKINRSYNKNGEIAFSEIRGINWAFCSLGEISLDASGEAYVKKEGAGEMGT